ncbi:cell cycle control protein (Cwf22) [Metarhizium album ARSEF 1941]|uniref:Pre-mRNA-splicing factor CWC22 n=1 Tax=Metarhizium album (strain ARSEF 1941) TaxID=1081103 RepID=A0A0B2WU27_METAS|nr:cell cycle control protein (Cwf22) [Metarhizium album ARSEF 1941]KHN99576.1 cell cycle control protein (Cwf22) [Metarhizium album ARSEF 1941]
MASVDVGIPRRERQRERGPQREADSYRPPPRERTPPTVRTEDEKQAAAKAEYDKLINMRSGGTYIPPARLRALQARITDKSSKEYQRMAWEALKKSINGLINKVNTANIKHIVPELFGENLIRGRGLFCRSIMKAQAASLPFTPIYAAMAAIVNTKLPQVGELLIKRLIMQFRKGFKRNDKSVCLSSTTFLAHLINQQVQHEMLAGQILLLLLHKPTDDSVEIAVGFCREVGQYLDDMQPSISLAVFDQFRNILHEADIDKRTQYMIEVLFQVRKDKFKDHPAIKEELDLVEEEDQITHRAELDGEIDVQDGLNIFKFDPNWEENEEAYRKLKAEILGEGSDYGDDDEGEDESSEEEEEEETKAMEIKDQSNADLVNLRRTIYLTIMSSADPEEAVHKLIKINLPAGQEPELPSMIVECCSQEKTYTKFFGLIGERFAKINRLWCDLFEQSFAKYYDTIHRYENNKLRNIAQLFGHMFGVDALGWHCLSVIHLNEDETTSSSRIFVKILFQSIVEEIGLPKLRARLTDETLRPNLEGIFPKDNPRNIRFSINYFTSIGLGALTEEMREYLQNMPKPALPAPAAAADDSDSDSDPGPFYISDTLPQDKITVILRESVPLALALALSFIRLEVTVSQTKTSRLLLGLASAAIPLQKQIPLTSAQGKGESKTTQRFIQLVQPLPITRPQPSVPVGQPPSWTGPFAKGQVVPPKQLFVPEQRAAQKVQTGLSIAIGGQKSESLAQRKWKEDLLLCIAEQVPA